MNFFGRKGVMSEQALWYKSATFYEVSVRAFQDSDGDGHGDIPGLISRLDYLAKLGVNCLWLNPIYPSPMKDDGYDISDFRSIHPDFGTMQDFYKLVEQAHRRDIRIILDLVLNHTSDQHPWFQAAKLDRQSPFHDYYVWSVTDQKYNDARIIFIDTEKSNWSWNAETSEYFWHRFYSSQPDLNYDNPLVREEMKSIMRFWLDTGIDGFRADAVPYLYEREDTICENLPETHAYLKELRKMIDEEYPGRILLCEANQWPSDVRPYFGDDDEFHMGFHFPLMPRIFMSISKADCSSIRKILDDTPIIPPKSQWCIFLRNHDELTLEMVTEEEREWLWSYYAPDQRMRLNLGIRRRLSALLNRDQRMIELANSLLFSLPGSPIIYYGDEIGMGDNIWLPDRNGVRTPMQWSCGFNAGFSTAKADDLYSPIIDDELYPLEKLNVEAQINTAGSLFQHVKGFIGTHHNHPALQEGSLTWVETSLGNQVACYLRRCCAESILVINNLSDQDLHGKIMDELVVEIGSQIIQKGGVCEVHHQQGQLSLDLDPYGYLWLLLE